MTKLLVVCSLCVLGALVSAQQIRQSRERYREPPPANGYQFSYNTGSAGPAQIFREETKDLDGSIIGKYGYIDPNGELRVINYRAAPESGFQASGDTSVEREPTARREAPPARPRQEVANRNYGPYPYTFHYDVPEHMGAYQFQQLYY